MKNAIGRHARVAAVVVAALVCIFLTACGRGPVVQTDTETVVSVTKHFYRDGDTLETYLDRLAQKGEISYKADRSTVGSLLTEVNGRKAGMRENWIIYTSDPEHSNKSWGTYEYEGKILGSASVGMRDLPVKIGEVYVLVISKS